MSKKKNDLKSGWTQLDLPFGTNEPSPKIEAQANNIIDFSLVLNSSLDREEQNIRRKSADYLLNYAHSLDW